MRIEQAYDKFVKVAWSLVDRAMRFIIDHSFYVFVLTVILWSIIFSIISCAPRTVIVKEFVTPVPGSTPVIQNALETIPKRYVDTEKGVVCYITGCDISCVKE